VVALQYALSEKEKTALEGSIETLLSQDYNTTSSTLAATFLRKVFSR
jgi:hypothetical protein